MNVVYLSGPIAGLTLRDATEWRLTITEDLLNYEIDVLDPMRDVTGDPDQIVDSLMADRHTVQSVDPALLTDRGMVVRDHNDVMRSDLLIVNLLDAHDKSIGTVSELAWAFDRHIPTIVIIEDKGNPHEHPFVRAMTSYRVDSLDRALRVAKSILAAEHWFPL